MFKILLLSVFGSLVLATAHGEEKTCAVKGMHCKACREMVQSKVCDQSKYSKCDVKILSEKKELGEIHLITKDAKAKIDEPAIGAVIKDAGYTLDKCTAAAGGAKG